ncbi:uncharacterized protein At1g65710-like [Phragmites australis]|uniref:uncharacterized protein At1g65710-like n=1 Tax=Phragmites australis TaxID=29695 RepID=UPI002D791530|nr:uncharacterized protein At1g65710-like [Phragmites australis]
MGLCFSKKQQAKRREGQPSDDTKKSGGKKAGRDSALAAEAKKTGQAKASAPAPPKKALAKPEEPAADKRKVFVVKAAAAAAGKGEQEEEVKRATPDDEAKPVQVGRVPVRTSSCTKEEVDAILIQCGRLSRSSSASGKAPSGEHGGGHRRYAGSKRSYDFDHERRGGGADDECDWGREGAAVSRPSPRRRTPERKRSASHEGRSGSGSGSRSRRVSRSPGRRADVAPAAGTGTGERAARQHPGKMVSVPAREKGRAPSPVKAAPGKRYPSPRSNSPARAAAAANENAGAQPTHGPSLSRSSSRKAEQPPYRRNPMAELDENTLGNNGKPQKKSTESSVAVPQKAAEQAKDQIPSSRTAKEKTEIVDEAVASDTKASSTRMNAAHSVSIVAESATNPRAGPGSRSSRRSSRDFDHNGNSYASLLLEDIQNYHQQNTSAGAAPAFSLPACVSKACSILEAVADLNSSSSEKKSFEIDRSINDKESVNGRYGGKAASAFVVESEVVVKDDLMEPSLHKYVSVRDISGETELQESAGSNSFAGNAWTCSWEPHSVESTDRTRTASQSNNGDEVEQLTDGMVTEQSWQSNQRPSSQEPSGRSRVGSTSNVQVQSGRGAHRGSVSAVSGR